MTPEWFQWSALLLGGGGLAGIVSAVVTWKHSTSDQWRDIVSAQTEHLIKPLEERISTLEQQVGELEGYRDHYMLAVEYLRKLFHWLAQITDRIDTSMPCMSANAMGVIVNIASTAARIAMRRLRKRVIVEPPIGKWIIQL